MKIIHFIIWTLFTLHSLPSFGLEPLSAVRESGRSYTEYLGQNPHLSSPLLGETVERSARSFTDEGAFRAYADQADLHPYGREEFEKGFAWIRDLRFLFMTNKPDFLRRISWLYPDDGCFARAEMAIRKLKENHFSGLKKIFIFGDLFTETPNSLRGHVEWWFHVAPLVKADGEYYVIDPAINPSKPLTVREWAEAMSQDLPDVRIAICHESAYDPRSSCKKEGYLPDTELEVHQGSYLSREWYRMIDLRRTPAVVLGDFPPWLNAAEYLP